MRAEWQAHIDELLGKYRAMRDQLGQTQHRIAEIRGTAVSANGWVTVTVGPRGELIDLELDSRIYRAPDSRGLAKLIVETTREATANAHRQLRDIIAPMLPTELGDLDGMATGIDLTTFLPEDPTDVSRMRRPE